MTAERLYLDLLKRCLVNSIYGAFEVRDVTPRRALSRWVVGRLAQKNMKVVYPAPADIQRRVEGTDWPPYAHTMTGLKALDALEECIEDVLAHGVPGDFIEAGVWRGGSSIFMRAALKAYRVTDRTVWVADSFEGLPAPDTGKYPQDAGARYHTQRELAVSLESVRENFKAYGLLDEQVRFLKGWFKDTLGTAPIGALALIRLDGDMYESTMDALTALYPKLSVGGTIIIDDYHSILNCRKAVDDFRARHAIMDELHTINSGAVHWKRAASVLK